jgi:exopolyphosphatase/guanosine-5'-triphosphate,3'-diphosphate pyrophosphatase
MVETDLDGQMFAAVDLGSNSFHLIVARFEHGQLQLIDRLREMVRLAAGMDDEGNIADEARDRAIECLARFGERLSGIPTEHVRALATNTLRRSRDPRAFLLLAETALGNPVDVISGHEEARLIYVGVSHDIAANNTKRPVVDIGGGSTELIVGSNERPDIIETLSAGCVTVSERFFADGKITRSALKAAQTAVALELRPIRGTYRSAGWHEAIGSSGTVRTTAQVIQESGWAIRRVTRSGLKRLRRALESAGRISRLDLPGLSEERRTEFNRASLCSQPVSAT